MADHDYLSLADAKRMVRYVGFNPSAEIRTRIPEYLIAAHQFRTLQRDAEKRSELGALRYNVVSLRIERELSADWDTYRIRVEASNGPEHERIQTRSIRASNLQMDQSALGRIGMQNAILHKMLDELCPWLALTKEAEGNEYVKGLVKKYYAPQQ